MTATHKYSTNEWLTMTDLLELLDTVTGYGIDRHSRKALSTLNDDHTARHVTTTEMAITIIQRYVHDRFVKLNQKPPRTERQRNSIVASDGFLNDATFNRDDIIRMLDDKIVQNTLAQQFQKRTTLIQGVYIPKVIADTHPIDPANKPMEDYL